MHTTLTPSCLHDATLCSLKNPRSPPYKSGAWPKACLWRPANNDVLFVTRISIQHFILRDQAAPAFGEEHLVAEFDRRLHLAALDEIGMGLENRIELLASWDLFAVEHAAARLIDQIRPQGVPRRK